MSGASGSRPSPRGSRKRPATAAAAGSRSPARVSRRPTLEFAPLTPERWRDLERLFGARGACGGCWCMYWRLGHSEFESGKGEGNRRAFGRLVRSGTIPGILAYVDGEPAGWCAIEPRDAYPRLGRSRILSPVDDETVWSIPCFFVARAHRRRGLTVLLLEAAARYARTAGARILEGYPVEPGSSDVPAAFAYTGLVPAFRAAGFVEVARRSNRRPVMRRRLRAPRS